MRIQICGLGDTVQGQRAGPWLGQGSQREQVSITGTPTYTGKSCPCYWWVRSPLGKGQGKARGVGGPQYHEAWTTEGK